MRETGPVAARIRELARTRSVRIALGVAAVAGGLSPLVPLADVPSYESALFANVIVGLLGGAFGIAAVRLERRIERGQVRGFVPSPAGFTAAFRATAAGLGLALLAIVPVFLASVVAGAAGAACSLTAGMPWFAVLPLASAPLAAALGVLAGAATERRLVAGLLYAAAVLGFTVAAVIPVLTGPQVFVYDHLLGYLPGPLYDEALSIRPPLLSFRLVTLAWATTALGLTALLWRGGRLGRPGLRPLSGLLLVLGAGGLALGHASRFGLGFEQTTGSVAVALGGRVEGVRCTLIHPRELRKSEVKRTLDECDLRVAQLEGFFGASGIRPTVFLYRSSEEKLRLVGAGGTQFAKPWLGQVHVDRRDFPHSILKHELAHVVAGNLGRGPFRIAGALGGIVPLPVLVEGAAVAADWPTGELTVHEQARAMRELGLAPELPGLLSPRAFFAESPRRAYVYAGSFVRWLVDTHGAERFGRLYGDADFAAAYGKELPELVTAWERHLDAIELSPRARAVAERRFKRPAIFRRPCAREVADLTAEASDALHSGDAGEAARLYERCAILDDGDPSFLLSRANALARLGDVDGVREVVAGVDRHHGADDVLRADAHSALGDAHVARGDWSGARDAWFAAQSLRNDRDGERGLAVKIEAAGDPELAAAVLPYLARGTDARLFAVRDLLERRPDYATGYYLVGRRLAQRDEHALALAYLDRALEGPLPGEALEREALRVRAVTLMALGRYAQAIPDLRRIVDEGEPGERLEAEDLLSFCQYGLTRIAASP